MYIVQSTGCLQGLYTQRGTSGVHMNDFSINNAPLIIVLLFKGEWQSFLSSRGGRGLYLREGLIYILESAPYSWGVCLSFSVNTDSELSLLWKTHRFFTHRLHIWLLNIFLFFTVCLWL